MFLEEEPKETRFQCRHILTDGHRCKSPCLKAAGGGEAEHEPFCYFHHTTRHPVTGLKARRARQSTFEMPLIEDRSAIQAALGEVLARIASNDLDPRRAGLLLYGLQIATLTLSPDERVSSGSTRNSSRSRHFQEPDHIATVEEVIDHPTLGPLAPELPYRAPDDAPVGYKTLGRRLIEELDRAKAKAEAAQKAREKAAAEAAAEAAAQKQKEQEDQPTILPDIQAVATLRPSRPSQELAKRDRIFSTHHNPKGAPSMTRTWSRVGRKPLHRSTYDQLKTNSCSRRGSHFQCPAQQSVSTNGRTNAKRVYRTKCRSGRPARSGPVRQDRSPKP